MMKNRDRHKDFSEIPGLQKAGYRHRDSGVNTEKNLCLYLLFISYPLCLSSFRFSFRTGILKAGCQTASDVFSQET